MNSLGTYGIRILPYLPLQAFFYLLWILPVHFCTSQEVITGREHFVSGLVGASVVLPCEVDTVNCGRIYVITWTKHSESKGNGESNEEWERVYLYSDAYSRALGELAGRAHFALHEGISREAELHLSHLEVGDEGTYKCDVTYVHGKCPSLTMTRLRTLMRPKPQELYVSGINVTNGTDLGPFLEGQTILIECKSTGGRPAPTMVLRNGSNVMDGVETTSKEAPDGSSEVVSSVKLVLSRWDLEGRLECRVESEAVPTPMSLWVKLDVHVTPISLRVRGPTTPVVAGEMVSLTCTVEGARPPSDITWFNRSLEVMPQPPASRDLMSDATWRTSSTLVFIASRHDHQGEFRCQGVNEVQRQQGKESLLHAVMLDVLYPPFVSAEPSAGLSVNESGEALLNCSFSANPPNVTEIAWYKNGEPQSFPPSTSNPSSLLTLKNISRKDAGSYSCHVRNAFGRGNSSNSIILNVLYPPEVNISVHPPVATEISNAILACHPIDGNPLTLISVEWYHNGKLLADQSTGDSQLTIQNLTRHQSGKYSCRGLNAAGWSYNSRPQYLDIHYSPGPAQLTLKESVPLKGGSVTFLCLMEDPGRPSASEIVWETPSDYRSSQESSEKDILKLHRVTAAMEGSYFCAGKNSAGTGSRGHYALKLNVAPTFVRPLPAVSGAPRNATSVRLVCHVECTPLCNISWYRDGQPLQDSKFFVQENLSLEEDLKRNLLPSMVGSLSWSPSHLPHSRFDSSTFSCRSSENKVGPGVNSSTIFRIEHAPEDVRLSSASMEVTEGEHAPREVTCTASAHPPGHFLWMRGDSVVSHSSALRVNASRDMAGNYSCTVWNEHGRMSKRFEFRVKHRPDCIVRKDFENAKTVLICRSKADPPVTSFTWFRENTSIAGTQDVHESLLPIPAGEQNLTRYSCISSNDIGPSDPCRLQISTLPSSSGWVLQEENLIIVVGVAGGFIALMLLMVITASVVAFRRRMSAVEKPEIDERQNMDVLSAEVPTLCSNIPTLHLEQSRPISVRGSMRPLLQEGKKKSPHRMLSFDEKPLTTNRRYISNPCTDMYRVRDIYHNEHGNNMGRIDNQAMW